jgi:hypothetical protein
MRQTVGFSCEGPNEPQRRTRFLVLSQVRASLVNADSYACRQAHASECRRVAETKVSGIVAVARKTDARLCVWTVVGSISRGTVAQNCRARSGAGAKGQQIAQSDRAPEMPRHGLSTDQK